MTTNTTKPLTVYLRHEPTIDDDALKYGDGSEMDVIAYKDAEAKLFYARWPWHSRKPERGCKTAMLNCYDWAVEWLPDVPRTKRELAPPRVADEARTALMEHVVKHMVTTLLENESEREQIARSGFLGFALMSNNELARYAINSGLVKEAPEVQELVDQIASAARVAVIR
ncbi:hypothetical protein F6X40_41690 [Paraburkholderia sp. UCT31]|uniref:hypothetical protein n=1 Tax=Paraburkholderia sp. UCT31 TaxID=2615209 RepID=UPI001655F538|nr:hypothetical protein [Paraburkholderia sp. UCT31]MBC8742968.1 hypothetical protein [Paraburkholderia sp. UCT31]